MNLFVPLFLLIVAEGWFHVATGRVAPTDPRPLLGVAGTLAAGAFVFLSSAARRG